MVTVINFHIALIGLVLVVLFAGLLQPRRKTAQRIFQLNATREDIWRIAIDFALQAKWRTDLKKVEPAGPVHKQDTWTEYPRTGKPMTYTLRTKVPHARFELESAWSGAFSIIRSIELRKVSFDQTIVTVTEYAEVQNPFTRVLVHLLFQRDDILERYAKDLTAEVQRVLDHLESQTS